MHLRIKYSSCCGLWPYAIWLAPASSAYFLSCFHIPCPLSRLHPVWAPPGLPASSPQYQPPCSLIPAAHCWDPYTQDNCECQLSQSWKARRESIFSTASSQNEPQVTNVGRVLIPPFPIPPPKHLPRNPTLFHFSNSPPLLHCNATFSVFNITIHLNLFLDSIFLFFLLLLNI